MPLRDQSVLNALSSYYALKASVDVILVKWILEVYMPQSFMLGFKPIEISYTSSISEHSESSSNAA